MGNNHYPRIDSNGWPHCEEAEQRAVTYHWMVIDGNRNRAHNYSAQFMRPQSLVHYFSCSQTECQFLVHPAHRSHFRPFVFLVTIFVFSSLLIRLISIWALCPHNAGQLCAEFRAGYYPVDNVQRRSRWSKTTNYNIAESQVIIIVMVIVVVLSI